MKIDELEAEALRLDPKSRARLAGRLLESLDDLSPEENTRIWAEEAQRRAAALDSGLLPARSADEVFGDARARI
ncbi:MAG: addiction module protein [Vicinamibacteraceae bacterium]